jgi:serine phosphatase RsbU (regulator of sigma subunit)/anti-sigma regulatory factor (Ser/Thr protein kinase)
VANAVRRMHGSGAVRSGATPIADVVRGTVPYLYPDHESLLEAYPEVRTDGGGAMAYLPMTGSAGVVGVCCLGWAEPRRFGAEAVDVMMMAATHLAQAFERTRLVENEHTAAEALQRKLMPRRVPEVPGVTVAARYVPGTPTAGVGGDWYDVVPLPQGRIVLLVGDVEGHGVESSAVMGQLRTALLASVLALHERGPTAVLIHADELLHRLDTDLMATCCVVCLDTSAGIAQVANAGHPAPLARHPDGRITILNDSVGPPLGLPIPAPASAEVFEVSLEPGALLLLHSNGIAGAADPDAVTSAHGKLTAALDSAQDSVDKVVDRLAQMAPAPLQDDVIILAAEYQGGDAEARPDIRRVEIQRHDLRGVQTARRVMESCLGAWNLTSVTDTADLVLSELVTNALIHADSDVDVRFPRYPDHVRLEVLDYDVHPPIPSMLSMRDDEENARAENGRGLALMDALGMDWGTSRTAGGKTVWAEIDTGAALGAK